MADKVVRVTRFLPITVDLRLFETGGWGADKAVLVTHLSQLTLMMRIHREANC